MGAVKIEPDTCDSGQVKAEEMELLNLDDFPITPAESVKDENDDCKSHIRSDLFPNNSEEIQYKLELLEKLVNASAPLKPTKIANTRAKKPRLKYRPENGTLLNLTSYNKSQSLESQDDNIDNQDLSFLHHAFTYSRKMVVVSGAGTSVASGIPDFRSANGLFQEYSKDAGAGGTGKQLFDYNVFRSEDSTKQFHNMIKKLFQISLTSKPTKFHRYLNDISQDNRLLRLYTQNIDCLDTQLSHLNTVAPLTKLSKTIPPTIQLHGNIQLLSCSKCHFITDMDPKYFNKLDDDEENLHPPCPECKESNEIRAIAGKRQQTEGILRPRIVLYNEFHPDGELIGDITSKDLKTRPDCLVVVGTTLKIPGVRRLVKEMAKVVHSNKGYVIWVNIDEPSMSIIDYVEHFDLIVTGDCQYIPDIVAQYDREFIQVTKSKTRARKTTVDKVTKPRTKSSPSSSTPSSKSSSKSPSKASSPAPLLVTRRG